MPRRARHAPRGAQCRHRAARRSRLEGRRRRGARLAGAAREPLPGGRGRPQRPRGDRLGRVRGSRDVSGQSAGHRGLQVRRAADPRGVDARHPAARSGPPGGGLMRRRLTRLTGVLLAALLVVGAAATAYAVDPTQLSDPKLQARYLALTHELRCMQCQNESLADSPVVLAADLRRQVRELLLAGKSDQDVRDWMTARYGDFILFRPRYSLRNAWLWGAPAALLLLGALVSWRVVRQRTTLLATDHDVLDEDGRP